MELELTVTLDDDAKGEHCSQFSFSVDYDGDGVESAFLCSASLVSIDMPDVITRISVRAFKNCTNLSEIYSLPDNLVIIEEEAFSGTNLTEITIPDGVTSIGKRAFANCRSLTSVTIPTSVTYVAENAFEGCDGLILYVPEELVDSYRSLWPDANIAIPYITANGSKAYCTNYTVLKTDELPDGCSGWSELPGGWYVVENRTDGTDFYLCNGMFTFQDDAHLILCDGAEMSVTDNYGIIPFQSLGTLTIYGQSSGTGTLNVINTPDFDGMGIALEAYKGLTINGGIINATTASTEELYSAQLAHLHSQ